MNTALAGEAFPRDTIFTQRFVNPPYDSGFHLVHVDQARDTLALFLRWIMGENPHIRVLGPVGGINKGARTKFWGLHRVEIQNKGEMFTSAEDFCTKGGNGAIENLSLRTVYETPQAICWEQSWRFWKQRGRRRDTLDIVRTLLLRRGEPYFLIHYRFTWMDAEPDSVRFLWYLQRQTKMGKSRSMHEVGYAPGYGMVTTRRAFLAESLGYMAGMMHIGNPRAAYTDTLADGEPSYLSPQLKAEYGSGIPGFAAGFIAFNPSLDIFPFEMAWIDTPGTYVPTLHFDSLRIRVDTTEVLDSEGRFFYARSSIIRFEPGQTRQMEYAVGRAVIPDDVPQPIIPDVIWSDGTILRSPSH
jgi:hypothetical protein